MSEEIQILALAGEGMSAREIADSLCMEPAAVEFVLARNGQKVEDDISDDDFEDIKNGLIEMAKHSENEHLRARVGMYLYDRKRGVATSKDKAPPVNIGQLNLLIAASHKQVIASINGDHNASVRGGVESASGKAGQKNGEADKRPPDDSQNRA